MVGMVLADLRRRRSIVRKTSPLRPAPRKTRSARRSSLPGALGRAEARRRDHLPDLDRDNLLRHTVYVGLREDIFQRRWGRSEETPNVTRGASASRWRIRLRSISSALVTLSR